MTFFDKFGLESIKWNDQILACMIVIWIIVVACAVSSVLSQSFERNRRIVWLVLIIGLPLFGLLAYLPFSVKREGLPQIFHARNTSKDRHHSRRNRSS